MPSHQSSKFVLILSLVVLCTITLHAQDVEITGTVTDQHGLPVAGAVLLLKNNNLYDTTDVNGSYILTNITGIGNNNKQKNPESPTLQGNFLSVPVSKPQKSVAVWIYTCTGKLITNSEHYFTKSGAYRVSLFGNAPAQGVYLVKVLVEGRVYYFKTVLYSRKSSIGKQSAGNSEIPQNRKIPSGETFYAVDTIFVLASGYHPKMVPVENLVSNVNITIEVIVDYPEIRILGPNPYILNIGDTYVEPGAIAYDSIDGDISDNIVISGSVNTAAEGDYPVTYKVSDSNGNTAVKTRYVHVMDSQGTDIEKPKITLNGDNPCYITVGDTYIDPGATATDNVDGNITYKIQVFDSAINTAEPDTHRVWYVVLDEAGNVAMSTRMVLVLSSVDITPPVITIAGPKPLYLTHFHE